MNANTLKVARLAATLGAIAPIDGVAVIGTVVQRIDFQATATQAQKDAAAAAVASFDWSDAADATYTDTVEPDLASMRTQAQNAFDSNTTYLAIASPTNAQVVAQVRALTQQNNRIIKALARLIVRAG